MKRKVLKILCILVALGALIGGWYIAIFAPTQYRFGPNSCYYMFGCSAEEFFDKDFEFYEETGDFRKTARINRKGELLIYLTKEQESSWIESDWFNVIYDAMGRTDIEVSPDLKVITLYTSDDMDEDSINEMKNINNAILIRIHFINGFNGNEKAKVIGIEKSIETGEEIGRVEFAFGSLVP